MPREVSPPEPQGPPEAGPATSGEDCVHGQQAAGRDGVRATEAPVVTEAMRAKAAAARAAVGAPDDPMESLVYLAELLVEEGRRRRSGRNPGDRRLADAEAAGGHNRKPTGFAKGRPPLPAGGETFLFCRPDNLTAEGWMAPGLPASARPGAANVVVEALLLWAGKLAERGRFRRGTVRERRSDPSQPNIRFGRNITRSGLRINSASSASMARKTVRMT